MGLTFLSERIVSPSGRFTQRSLNKSLAELSCVNANRVPTCTPSAPRANAANILLPLAIPPAAITGKSTELRTCDIRVSVVVSSLPLWPPASNPSATTASTPASSDLCANFELETKCATFIPSS